MSNSNLSEKKPIFSIVMPAFNAAGTICESIDSVIAQTFKDWELLVVDDSSSDQTAVLVEDYAARDPRIQLIRADRNLKVAGARNLGMSRAQGRYVAFLDSDDWWLKPKLEMQKAAFDAGAKLVYSSYWRFFPDGRKTLVKCRPSISFRHFYFFNPIGNLTGAFDREALGPVEQQAVRHEDFLMWYQLVTKAGRGHGIEMPLAMYRVTSNSLSGSKLSSASWHWNILRNHFRLGLIPSVLGFFSYAFHSVMRRATETLTSK